MSAVASVPPDAPAVSRLGKRLQGMEIGRTSESMGDEALDRGERARRENRFVFEVAWEVANKGMGILVFGLLFGSD